MTTPFERHRREELSRQRRLRWLLKPLPRRANLRRYPVLRWFGDMARKAPFLWSFKQRHVLRAIYAGSIIAFLPFVGLQILIAFAAALLLRANLTIAAALQFITNPFTIGPVYFGTYKVGQWLIAATGIGGSHSDLGTRINALIIGGVVIGLLCAIVLHGVYRLLSWESRRFKAHGLKLRQLLHLERQQVDAGASYAPTPGAEDARQPEPESRSGPEHP